MVLAQKAPSVLTLRDPATHRSRRQRVTLALSKENIAGLQPSMQGHIEEFVEKMAAADSKGWSEVRNMTQWCSFLAFDMMMSMIFTTTLKLVTDKKSRHVPKAIHMASRRQIIYMQSIKLAILALLKLDENVFGKEVKARDTFVSFLRTLLKSRYKQSLNEETPSNDVYSLLKTQPSKNNELLTPAELNAECANLMVAGSDTTATTLNGTLFYLSRYRDAYDRCAEEVRSQFQSTDDITVNNVHTKLPYTKACIQEALRLSPPVGSSVPRETPKGGAVIDGNKVPGGMLIGTGIYSLHRNAKHFSDPHTYRPERFLPNCGGAADLENHNMNAYGPFQIGTRSCVGRHVAMQELLLSISNIMFSLDFEAINEKGKIVTVHGSQPQPIAGVNDLEITEYVTAQGHHSFLRWKRRQEAIPKGRKASVAGRKGSLIAMNGMIGMNGRKGSGAGIGPSPLSATSTIQNMSLLGFTNPFAAEEEDTVPQLGFLRRHSLAVFAPDRVRKRSLAHCTLDD